MSAVKLPQRPFYNWAAWTDENTDVAGANDPAGAPAPDAVTTAALDQGCGDPRGLQRRLGAALDELELATGADRETPLHCDTCRALWLLGLHIATLAAPAELPTGAPTPGQLTFTDPPGG